MRPEAAPKFDYDQEPAEEVPALHLVEVEPSTELIADLPTPKELGPEQLEIIERFWELVPAVVHRVAIAFHINDRYEREELMADGYYGLVRAARDFDPAKLSENATTGSDYIYRTIYGEIMKALRAKYGRRDDRIAKIKPSVILGTAVSFDQPLHEGEEDNTVANTIIDPGTKDSADESLIAKVDVEQAFEAYLLTVQIEKRQPLREIFIRYFVLDQTQAEIAEALSYSQMHISRLVNKIRAGMQEKLSPNYKRTLWSEV